MDQDSVYLMMSSSRTEAEWNANCDKVKAHFGGYPSWWYQTIIMGGVLRRASAKWAASKK